MSAVVVSLSFLLLSVVSLTSASVHPPHPHDGISHHTRHWLISFLSNAFGYSLLLLPAAGLILFVKSKSCPPQSKSQFTSRTVRLTAACRQWPSLVSTCCVTIFLSFPPVRRCYPIRVFVFGKELHEEWDVEQQDVSDVEDDKSPGSGSLHRATKKAFGANRVFVFTCCFVGLQVSYLLWGLLQEKIMTTNYTVTPTHSETSDPLLKRTSFTPLPSPASQATGSSIRTFQFHDSQFLVLVNRVLAFFVAIIAIVVKNGISRRKRISYKKVSSSGSGKVYSIAPLYEFSFCSISNILSSWCQYEALKYVNFPTQVCPLVPSSSLALQPCYLPLSIFQINAQVLSKACKLLPVMIMSTIISGKKYRFREYVIVIVISCGMFLFLAGNEAPKGNNHYMTTDATASSPRDREAGTRIPADEAAGLQQRRFSLIDGLLILSLYLTFDSFTSNWQEKLNSAYRVSPLQMMAVVNFFSILLTMTSLAQQFHLIPSLLTVLSNAHLARDCVLMSLSSATGQLMIFYTISEFGALAFTFIMTLRQVFAIVLSCLMYGHPLNDMAITGICIVFVGLFAQIYFKSRKSWASGR